MLAGRDALFAPTSRACTEDSTQTCARSSLPVVTDVARSLTFAPAVRALAEHVIAGISAGGAGGGAARREFNAAHLRLEKDARDWSAIMGGEAVRPNSQEGITLHKAEASVPLKRHM